METPLHAQKVAILSRLIKENALTQDEALLLLRDEKSFFIPDTVKDIPVYNSPVSGTIYVSNSTDPASTFYTYNLTYSNS